MKAPDPQPLAGDAGAVYCGASEAGTTGRRGMKKKSIPRDQNTGDEA